MTRKALISVDKRVPALHRRGPRRDDRHEPGLAVAAVQGWCHPAPRLGLHFRFSRDDPRGLMARTAVSVQHDGLVPVGRGRQPSAA